MRVTDRILQQTFLYNLDKHKIDLQNTQEQITTRSKVNRPSDSPAAASRILRLQTQLNGLASYQKNIQSAQSYLDSSALALNGIGSEIENLLVNMTEMNDAAVTDLSTYATKLGMSIDTILDFANSKFDGQYLFGGTNHSTDPFVKSGSTINASSNNLDGEQKIRISTTITQKINITGNELFLPQFKQSGNINSSAAVGSTTSNTTTILDPDGNEYSMNVTYTKTAANTYSMNYDITDASSSTVTSGTHALVFGSDGKLSTIDGSKADSIYIDNSVTGIKLDFDVTSLTESTSATQVIASKKQGAEIFRTLLSIKENLAKGIKPTTNQIAIVKEFSQHLINKTTEVGSIMNRLESTNELLSTQTVELSELLSNEKDVDVAEAIMDLNNTQFNLDLGYKISSMILPKSLVDFL